MNEHLKATLGLDNGPFVRNLRNAAARANDFKSSLADVTKIIGASFLGEAGKRLLEMAHGVKVLRDVTGLSAGTIQVFRKAAGKVGEDAASSDRALEKLVVKIGEAQSGSAEAAKTFRDLNVELFDSQQQARTTQAIYDDVAESLGKLQDPAEKSRLAVKLFGESGAKLSTIFDNSKKSLAAMRAEMGAAGVLISDADITRLDGYYLKVKQLGGGILNLVVVGIAKAVKGIENFGTIVGTVVGLFGSEKWKLKDGIFSVERLAKGFEAVYENDKKEAEQNAKNLVLERQRADEAERTAAAKKKANEEDAKAAAEQERIGKAVQDATRFSSAKELAKLTPQNQFKDFFDKAKADANSAEAKRLAAIGIDPNKMSAEQAMTKAGWELQNRQANGNTLAAKDREAMFGKPLPPQLALDAQRAALAEKYLAEAERMRGTNPQGANEAFNRAELIKAKIASLNDEQKKFGNLATDTNTPQFPNLTMPAGSAGTSGVLDATLQNALRYGAFKPGQMTPQMAMQKMGLPLASVTQDQYQKSFDQFVKLQSDTLKRLTEGVIVLPKNGP